MSEEAANRGIVRPPLVYLCAIILGLLINFLWPIHILSRAASFALGVMVVIGAVVIFTSAVRAFRRAGTPIPGGLPTVTIVRSGPYSFSRNPIYLAFSLIQIGIALLFNSVWIVFTLVPAVAIMAFVVIPREERYLESKFQSDYLSYKGSVRRWL
jgi:protein-S-isoprenylcysteine O-methyltransferase Ste14